MTTILVEFVPSLHTKFGAPVAISVVLVPLQMVGFPAIVMVGSGLTWTVNDSVFVHVPKVPVTV